MERFTIGYRTIKTAAGTGLAIALAQLAGLQFYSSAGILTILCIKITKKSSLISSWERFLACVLGILFASVFFSAFGYHPITLSIMLLVFIPTIVVLNAKEGIITSSVIILHLYTLEKLSWKIIGNEIGIIVIGISVALIMNLYMPSMEETLKKYQKDIELHFKKIFHEFYLYLVKENHDWDGKEITEAAFFIAKAKSMAFRDVENNFKRDENSYYYYFKMREKQFEIIERIMPMISSIDRTYIQGKKLGEFFEILSDAVHPGNTAVLYLNLLDDLRKEFQEMDLPKDREEFEARSKLFYILNEVEQYLAIKRNFKQSSNHSE